MQYLPYRGSLGGGYPLPNHPPLALPQPLVALFTRDSVLAVCC